MSQDVPEEREGQADLAPRDSDLRERDEGGETDRDRACPLERGEGAPRVADRLSRASVRRGQVGEVSVQKARQVGAPDGPGEGQRLLVELAGGAIPALLAFHLAQEHEAPGRPVPVSVSSRRGEPVAIGRRRNVELPPVLHHEAESLERRHLAREIPLGAGEGGPDGVVLDHCTIGPSSGRGGLVVDGSSVTATSTTFTGVAANGACPLVVRGASSRLTLSDATFTGNWRNEVVLEPGGMTGADFTLSPQDGLDAYRFTSEYEIPEGRTVTVLPGVTVRQPWTTWVRGRLVAEGTPARPVVLAAGRGDIDGNPAWIGITVDGGPLLLGLPIALPAGPEDAAAVPALGEGALLAFAAAIAAGGLRLARRA
jgi:hypothetical protein